MDDKSVNIPDSQLSVSPKHSRRHHTSNSDTSLRKGPLSSTISKYPHSNIHKDGIEGVESSIENIIGSRKFVWKVLSFSQCSSSCGGGTQLGKFRCVEVNNNSADKEVSTVHCSGSPPPNRRRRCGTAACPPKWRSAAWSSCPSCGPANRTRIVGCVQDHSHGIIKVSIDVNSFTNSLIIDMP